MVVIAITASCLAISLRRVACRFKTTATTTAAAAAAAAASTSSNNTSSTTPAAAAAADADADDDDDDDDGTVPFIATASDAWNQSFLRINFQIANK